MTILVTTPRGKVGSHLVHILKERHVPLRLGAHEVQRTKSDFPGLDTVPLEYDDESTLREAVRDVSAIYLAAPGHFTEEPEIRLIDAAKAAGVRKIVKLSALGVEQTEAPLRKVERHVQSSGLSYVLLRPTWFSQNYATTHAAAIKSGTLAEPAAGAKTAFIDTRDIAEVAARALTSSDLDGQAHELTGPELLDRNRVAAILSKELARDVRYAPLSDSQFRAGVQGVLPPSYVELLSALYSGVRAGVSSRKTEEVQRILGRPATSFAQFVRDHRHVWQ